MIKVGRVATGWTVTTDEGQAYNIRREWIYGLQMWVLRSANASKSAVILHSERSKTDMYRQCKEFFARQLTVY